MKIGNKVKIVGGHYSSGLSFTACIGDIGTIIKDWGEDKTWDWIVHVDKNDFAFSEDELEIVGEEQGFLFLIK